MVLLIELGNYAKGKVSLFYLSILSG